MHLFVWAGAVVAGNSLVSNVLYDMFPQVGLGEVPVELERCEVAALDGINISLYLRLVQDSVEFRDGYLKFVTKNNEFRLNHRKCFVRVDVQAYQAVDSKIDANHAQQAVSFRT